MCEQADRQRGTGGVRMAVDAARCPCAPLQAKGAASAYLFLYNAVLCGGW
jgi:hypothetical protein